jgi:spermidine/putrescine transport system substrate-binding protein
MQQSVFSPSSMDARRRRGFRATRPDRCRCRGAVARGGPAAPTTGSDGNRSEMQMMIQPTTRRRFLSVVAGGLGVAAMPAGRAARAATPDLSWLTWDANAKPSYVVPFEKAMGSKVRLSYLTSEDAQFAALKAGARLDYDVVNPSINGVWRYIDGHVIKPLDLARIPNVSLMYPAFKTSDRVKGMDGQTYAIPYLWGVNPIVYRADKLPAEPDYATLFDANRQ